MSLPAAYAPLSMSMIITELDYGGALTNISLSGSETGLYGTINTCSVNHPDGVSPFAISEWGEAGTDQIPMSYLCQCIW